MTATPAAPAVRRTPDVLADGRQIIYFDDTEPYVSGQATRATPDTRPLEPADPGHSQLRFDVLTGEWVTIASHRNTRTFMPPPDECPLCPTGRGRVPSEIPAHDYDVVVFENRFPSFTMTAVGEPGDIDGEPLFPSRPGIGRCEVVSFTADHDASFASLEPHRARTVVEAWADRTAELSALPGIRQVFPFENRGREIGVTLHPPARPDLRLPVRAAALRAAPAAGGRAPVRHRRQPARRRAGRRAPRRHPDRARRRALDGVRAGRRRWPFEVHLSPHRDVPDFAALDDARARRARARLPRAPAAGRPLLRGRPALPYIAAWFQAPVGEQRELGRLHLQLFSVMRARGG